ncbi:MAG: hypothetical protein RR533_06005 [Carnobacterium sp.]
MVVAGLIKALKLVYKTFETCKVVVTGADSAGIAVTKHLLNFDTKNLILTNKSRILTSVTPNLNTEQQHMTTVTYLAQQHGDLTAALKQEARMFS